MTRIASARHYEAFQALLVEKRGAAGLTQQDVADRIDWPQSAIAKIENGERRLDVVEFVVLAQVIGFDPVKALREYCKKVAA